MEDNEKNMLYGVLLAGLALGILCEINAYTLPTPGPYDCKPCEYVGSCGVFEESDLLIEPDFPTSDRASQSFGAEKDYEKRSSQEMLKKILNENWHKNFKCQILASWRFWSDADREKVMNRLADLDLISGNQLRKWQQLKWPPCTKECTKECKK